MRFEPLSALVAPDAGFADIDFLIQEARAYLEPGGWLVLEHGWRQGEAVRALFTRAGFNAVETGLDYGGNERLTMGQITSQE